MKDFLNIIKKDKKFIFEAIAIFLIILFSYSIAPKILQNDTYYTIPIGNLIMENGIDMKDHFSWHEDLPYTYPHWLFDVGLSLVYKLGGWGAIYVLVCFLSITLGLIIYAVNQNITKSKLISFAITIGVMYLLKGYVAARAQLFTFIIYMIVIFCIEKFLENPKRIQYGLGIIISSILIANTHSAVWPLLFIISLPYFAEEIIVFLADFIIYKKLKLFVKKLLLKKYKNNKEKSKKITEQINKIYLENQKIKKVRETEEPYKIKLKRNKNVKWLFIIIIICAFTGLLTPLKDTPYTYLYKTLIGSTTKNINEHLPLTLANDIPIMCTFIIIIAILTFTKIKIRLSDLFMIGGLTYLTFSSKRQITMLALIGSLILNKMIVQAIEIYTKEKIQNFEQKLINYLTVGIAIILVIGVSIDFIKEKKDIFYVSKSIYPVDASEWILNNLDVNNIKLFNEYNYGSYLIFKGIPVFIDSRADLYTPEFNKTKGKAGRNVFMDFINVSGIDTFYENIFEKYGITHIILYKNSRINMIINKADSEKYNELYSDSYFVIYEIVKK